MEKPSICQGGCGSPVHAGTWPGVGCSFCVFWVCSDAGPWVRTVEKSEVIKVTQKKRGRTSHITCNPLRHHLCSELGYVDFLDRLSALTRLRTYPLTLPLSVPVVSNCVLHVCVQAYTRHSMRVEI